MRQSYIVTAFLVLVFIVASCAPQSVPPTGQVIKNPDAVVYVDTDNNGVLTEGVDRRMAVSADEFGNYEIRVTNAGEGIIVPASSRIRAKEEGAGIYITTTGGGITIGDSATLQAPDNVLLVTPGNIKIGLKAKLVSKSSAIDIDSGGNVEIGDGTALKAPEVSVSNINGRGPMVGNKIKIQTESLYLTGLSIVITNSLIKLGTNGYASIDVYPNPDTGYAIDLSGTSFSGKDYNVFGYGTPSNTATTRFRGKPSYISFE